MEAPDFEYGARARLLSWPVPRAAAGSAAAVTIGDDAHHPVFGQRFSERSLSVAQEDKEVVYALDMGLVKGRLAAECDELLAEMQDAQSQRSRSVIARNREKAVGYWLHGHAQRRARTGPLPRIEPASAALSLPLRHGAAHVLTKNPLLRASRENSASVASEEDDALTGSGQGVPHRRARDRVCVRYVPDTGAAPKGARRTTSKLLFTARKHSLGAGPDRLRTSALAVHRLFPSEGSRTAAEDATNVSDDSADRAWVHALFTPLVLPLPRSMTWVPIRENVRSEDEPILKYFPYFGDEDQTGIDLSGFDEDTAEPEVCCEAREATAMHMLLRYGTYEAPAPLVKNHRPKDVPLRLPGDFNVLNESASSASTLYVAAEVLAALRKSVGCATAGPLLGLFARCVDAMRLRRAAESPSNAAARARMLAELGGDASLLALVGPGSVTVSSEELAGTGLGLRSTADYRSMSESYRELFCRRCYTYDCRVHGIQQPLPRLREQPRPPFVCPVIGLSLPMTESVFVPEELKAPRRRGRVAGALGGSGGLGGPGELGLIGGLGELGELGGSGGTVAVEEEALSEAAPSPCMGVPFADMFGSCALFRTELCAEGGGSPPPSTFPPPSKPSAKPSAKPAPPRMDSVPKQLYASQLTRSAAESKSLEPVEVALIKQLVHIYGRDDTEALSLLLGTRTPSQIKAYLGSVKRKAEASEDAGAGDEEAKGGGREPPQRGKKARKGSVRKEYQPCDHAGPCRADNCSCLQSTGFCEKFCACSNDCKHRFPGCKCKRGCRTNLCPCYASSRECDPDLCGACGVAVHPLDVPATKLYLNQALNGAFPGLPETSVADGVHPNDFKFCQNACLRNNEGKKMFVGRSNVHGWGGFAGQNIDKNDFLTEYCGEIVSQDEADRRGKVYDKLDSSFLFNLNDDLVVDAMRRGNIAKFINHSEKPNCYPRILQVNGDHRIGLFAKRQIVEGEELSFSYGYANAEDRAHKPAWIPQPEQQG